MHKAVALQFGDVDEAIDRADHVFDDVFFFEGNTHLPIEQHASVALKDPDGKLVVYSSTQTPHYLHRALAKALAMPAAHIRVIATPNGGGFGGKSDPFNHEIVVAKAALLLDRPVKICLNREEVFYCHRGRHPVLMRFRTGVTSDGRIAGLDLQTLLDGGAYGSYGVASTFYTGALQTVTYDIPRYRFRGCRVFTNKPPCGPKRGHGTPQSRFGQEVQLDKIAEFLKQDPAELRLGIIAPADQLTANYLRVKTIGLADCIRRVVDRSNWKDKFRKLPLGRGMGLACSSYLSGAGLPINWNDLPHSGVQLKLDRSGGVTAFCGATEIGQGSDDVLAALVAEVLGIDPFDIRVVTGDTDLTPVDLGSYSSRVTLMMGHAAIEAAERAREMLAAAVSARLEVAKDRLVFAERTRVRQREPRSRRHAFRRRSASPRLASARLARPVRIRRRSPPRTSRAAASVRHRRTRTPLPWSKWKSIQKPAGLSSRACGLPTTSAARSTRRSFADRSRAASTWALAKRLMEEQAFRRLPQRLSHALVHKFPSMLEYKSPTSLDMPEIFTDLDRASRSGGSLRREGSRPGAAAADHARGCQRGLRRRRRARRSDSRDAGENPARAASEGRRQAGAIRAGGVSRYRLAGAAARRPAVGRRGWPRIERARSASRVARPTPASKRPPGCDHDAAAAASAIARPGPSKTRRPGWPKARAPRCSLPAAPTCCRT